MLNLLPAGKTRRFHNRLHQSDLHGLSCVAQIDGRRCIRSRYSCSKAERRRKAASSAVESLPELIGPSLAIV